MASPETQRHSLTTHPLRKGHCLPRWHRRKGLPSSPNVNSPGYAPGTLAREGMKDLQRPVSARLG